MEINNYSSKDVKVVWVKAHNGNRWNEYVDSLTKV
jgi:ribonuclease HI